MSSIKPRETHNGIKFFAITWSAVWGLTIIILLLAVAVKFIFFQQVTVVGSSMVPNYQDGQLLLVNQVDKAYHRGQVMAVYADRDVAKSATESDAITNYMARFSARFFLKRIIALPGEEIEIVGSKIIIYNDMYPNGGVLQEDYIPQSTVSSEEARNYYYPRTKIADKFYFVMGDNRSNSTDSRSKTLGTIPEYSLFGQEAVRFWPASTLDFFKLPAYKYNPIDSTLKARRDKLISLNSETQFSNVSI
ncbi:MAG: signal peptidase I [bacterium]